MLFEKMTNPKKDNPIQNLIAKPELVPHPLLSKNFKPNTSLYLHNVQGNKGLSFEGLKATRDRFRQQLLNQNEFFSRLHHNGF